MDPAQYQSRNPYLAPTRLLRATGRYYTRDDLSRWDEAFSVMRRQLHFVVKSSVQHFNILKRQLLSQNVFQQRKYRSRLSDGFSKSFRFLLKPCSDLMLGVTPVPRPLIHQKVFCYHSPSHHGALFATQSCEN